MANIITDSARVRRLQAIYGESFPDPEEKDKKKLAEGWLAWLKGQIALQRGVMEDKRLHWARHRLFRQGRQWISTRDGKHWRELNADENRVRAVFNMIGPALDFRVSLLQEQRPGFKHQPLAGQGVSGRETAEAQQSVAEWYFFTQKIWPLAVSAMSEAQTDGVAFLNVYIDKQGGPQLENVELIDEDDERFEAMAAQGYRVRDSGLLELPLATDGTVREAGQGASKRPAGDIRTRLLLAHETWADPEAKTILGADRRAKWFLVRRVRDLHSARIQLDDEKLEADVEGKALDPLDVLSHQVGSRFQRGLPPFPGTRQRLKDGGVFENMLYLAPSEEFPEGKWVEVITPRHLRSGELPGGVIPIARFTDGSTDDELYPRPVMSDWISDSISINSLGSKILEYSRLHSGTQLMAMEGTLLKETWTDIVGSVVEYKGPKPDHLPAPRVSSDLWQMWTQMIRQLEAKTGWTDLARGKLTGEGGFQDIAGRAVLAARELFERQFGPMVRAAAAGGSDWAEIVVRYAQHLYEVPRLVPMSGRPDLAKRIDGDMLAGDPSVYIEPETLQPLPRALRNQLLFDYMQQGLISVAEFKKRAPFAEIRDLNMGDSDQWNRAQMVNTVLEERWEELAEMEAIQLFDVAEGLAVFWQDEPEVHMKALDELILDDRKPFALRKLAADRWGIYMELSRTKQWPEELVLQGFERPPAPAEVVGVPNSVAQRTAPSVPQTVQGQGQGGGTLGAQQGASPAPELSGSNLPSASTDRAQPLGRGAAEKALVGR
jgi:hypothetical protein